MRQIRKGEWNFMQLRSKGADEFVRGIEAREFVRREGNQDVAK
jgi:hypothetical protein